MNFHSQHARFSTRYSCNVLEQLLSTLIIYHNYILRNIIKVKGQRTSLLRYILTNKSNTSRVRNSNKPWKVIASREEFMCFCTIFNSYIIDQKESSNQIHTRIKEHNGLTRHSWLDMIHIQ